MRKAQAVEGVGSSAREMDVPQRVKRVESELAVARTLLRERGFKNITSEVGKREGDCSGGRKVDRCDMRVVR